MGPTNQFETCIYSLTAAEASVKDSGEWRCELTNSYGTSEAKCSVKVLDSAEIDTEVAPSFAEYLENVAVVEDKPFKFRCKALGKPEPEVKWFRNEIPIDTNGFGSDARYFIRRESDGTEALEVRAAKLRDTGVYKCKVMNSLGWAACDAKLVVQEAPDDEIIPYSGRAFDYTLADKIKARRALERPNHEADIFTSTMCDSDAIRKFLMKWSLDEDQTLGFPVHLSSKCAVAGVSVVLGCLVKGQDPLRIRWYKDNKEVFDDGQHFIRRKKGFLSLEIPCAQVEDTGNYMCEVRNDQGKIYTSCYLQVEPVLEITNEVPIKPIFVKPMKRLTVNEGEMIRFRVTVKAYPAPGFKWFKDGMEIHDTDRISTEVIPNGVAQLIIEQATVRDIGLYTCEAHNFAGRARNMVRISVRDQWEAGAWRGRSTSSSDVTTPVTSGGGEEGPVTNGVLPVVDFEPSQRGGVFAYEPMFTLKLPLTLTIEDRGHFLLECCCNGNPRPTVTWLKDSKPLEGDRYRFISVGDWHGLEILESRPDDAGIYTVLIDNSAGEVMSSCTVIMKLFKVQEENVGVAVEKTGEISDRIAGISALQSEHAVELFRTGMYGIAQIVPSCHLCNTEADWSAIIDKEIEVIEAIESPSFTKTLPDRITPTVNDADIRLSCRVAGQPCPKVEWFKDNELIENVDGIVKEWDFKDRLATLVFTKITSAMSGKYSCVAYSDFGGHASTVTEMDVKGTDEPDAEPSKSSDVKTSAKTVPGFKVKLHDTETRAGSEVKLEVKAEGYPTPAIKWYKNDQEIKDDKERYSIASTDDGLHTLVIAKVHLSDSDCYKCEAINDCGSVSTCAHVIVQEECKVNEKKGSAPSFSEPLHSVTALVGQAAVLDCTAEGYPAPTLTWMKGESKADLNNERIKIVVDGNSSTLRIANVTPADAGTYYCIAENEHGQVKSCANLKVNASQAQTTNDPNKDSKENVNKPNDGKSTQNAAINASDSNTNQSNASSNNSNDGVGSGSGSVDQSDSATRKLSATTPQSGETDTKYKLMPRFVSRPFSQWVVAKGPLEISCQVVKSDDTKVRWYHNGVEVKPGRYKMDIKPCQV